MKQKRIGKKAVSWLLTLVMLTGLLPMPTALAADDTTVTVGKTYYFDLSGAGIPGMIYVGLPDKSLHYVPFTYVESVNAYVLKAASSGVTSASTDAGRETDPNATYGYKYDHRLFVADYNVAQKVSWNALDNKELIFGKNNYISNDITYSLRAPSAGNQSLNVGGSSGSKRIYPINNEWDAILNKNYGQYIKNLDISSWGQDTTVTDDHVSWRASRGASWSRYTPATENAAIGFRPVLELPSTDTLPSDGLKAVTLNLNGGKLGSGKNAVTGPIQIVVEDGAKFTAPASDGLTRPTGNTDTYFRWLGDDGNRYVPGDLVPSTVTALTALYENLPDLTINEPGTITYDGAPVTVSRSDLDPTADLTYTCQAEADRVVTVTAKWCADNNGSVGNELTSGAPTDAGTYWLVLTTAATDTYAAGRWEQKFTISPMEISMTGAAVTTKEYNGNTDATITPGTLEGVLAADQGADKVSVKETSIKGTFASADAGENIGVTTTKVFTLEGDRASNYTLTQPTDLKGTIKPKEVVIKALDKSATVGASAPSLESPQEGSEYTVTGLVNGDQLTDKSITLSYANNLNMDQPGDYVIILSGGAASDNYTISRENGTLRVSGYVLPGKNQNVTTDDVILRPANGGSATKKDDGSYSVTGGGSVVLPGADQNKATANDNVTVNVDGPFDVKPDGTVILPGGSTATVGGKTDVTGPGTIKPDGTVEEDGTIGDPNGDGEVNMDDALEILNYVLEIGSEYIK